MGAVDGSTTLAISPCEQQERRSELEERMFELERREHLFANMCLYAEERRENEALLFEEERRKHEILLEQQREALREARRVSIEIQPQKCDSTDDINYYQKPQSVSPFTHLGHFYARKPEIYFLRDRF